MTVQEMIAKIPTLTHEERRQLLDALVEALNAPPPGSLAELAQAALDANLASRETVDTADRSREILSSEYADALKRRTDHDDHSG